MKKYLILFVSHMAFLFVGFAGGMFMLPILIAPPSPDKAMLEAQAKKAVYETKIERNLRGNDMLHWGEGTLSITPDKIVFDGKLSPGPDYQLYLVDKFVEHEDEFLPIKDKAKFIGYVKTFDGFILDVPRDVNIEDYNTAIVRCESFSEFITAGKYK